MMIGAPTTRHSFVRALRAYETWVNCHALLITCLLSLENLRCSFADVG